MSDSILEWAGKDDERITKSFQDLWEILLQVARDPKAGEIICILDALDECEEPGRSQLSAALCKLYWDGASHLSLKFLLTSRAYTHIQRDFQRLKNRLPTIHLSGENETEVQKISQEIDKVIGARTEDLGATLSLSSEERQILRIELTRNPNRTYLWVSLICDVIKKTVSTSPSSIRTEISRIPSTLDEAYEKILSRSPDIKKARKVLHIIVGAQSTLTLKEMGTALAISKTHRSLADLQPEQEEQVRSTIRGLCGLFVTIVSTRVYLLHQTAKEFLIGRQAAVPLNRDSHTDVLLPWKHSLLQAESDRVLAEICIRHLLLVDFDTTPIEVVGTFSTAEYRRRLMFLQDHPFFSYSATYWGTHFRNSDTQFKEKTEPLAIGLCDARETPYSYWFRIYWTHRPAEALEPPENLSTLDEIGRASELQTR